MADDTVHDAEKAEHVAPRGKSSRRKVFETACFTIVAVAMWTVCTIMTIDLCVKHFRSGRKEKTDLERTTFREMDPPWVMFVGEIGTKCDLVPVACEFNKFKEGEPQPSDQSCLPAIERRQLSFYGKQMHGYLLNQSTARDASFVYQTLFDSIAVTFVVAKVSLTSTQPVQNMTECGLDDLFGGPPVSATLVPIADAKTVTKLQGGKAVVSDLGTPLFVGFNHFSVLSFTLQQEHFVGGGLTNSSTFKTTQFALPPVPQFSLTTLIYPDTFHVTHVKHIEGSTIVSLLGNVFGWVGVWTGASIQGVLVSALALYTTKRAVKKANRRREAARAEEESGSVVYNYADMNMNIEAAELMAVPSKSGVSDAGAGSVSLDAFERQGRELAETQEALRKLQDEVRAMAALLHPSPQPAGLHSPSGGDDPLQSTTPPAPAPAPTVSASALSLPQMPPTVRSAAATPPPPTPPTWRRSQVPASTRAYAHPPYSTIRHHGTPRQQPGNAPGVLV